MELDAIAVFVKIVEAGSFSGAAKLLQMPKTTVSAKLAALERRLGVTLIQRTTRQLRVTDAGQNYFRHCAAAIQEIEQGESDILQGQSRPTGLLKVTAPVDLGHTLLPRIAAEYLKRHPETEIELIVTNRMVDIVGEGVDLALRAGELKDSSLIARKFLDFHPGLWASPAYLKKHGTPAHPRELPEHHLVVFSGLRGGSFELTDGKVSVSVPLKGRLKADDLETIKSALLLNLGIGWLPDFLLTRELRTGSLVPVLPKWRTKQAATVSFVYAAQKFASPKLRAFIETALEVCGRELPR
jgi:DNA-binding transcriptional LysR family regulator